VAPAAADRNALEFDVLSYLGNLSPMKSVHTFGLPGASPQIPEGCELKQAHLLHRHGARYPGSGGGGQQLLLPKSTALLLAVASVR
jgi:hypothetical protein